MTTFSLTSVPILRRPRGWFALLLLAAVAALGMQAIFAQVGGDRGIAPVVSTGDTEVHGVEVDVVGSSPEDARQKGWMQAQRKAWEKLNGPKISDSELESMVTAIEIEKESIGNARYIATLGVIFDRARSGALLGSGGAQKRSSPMLTIPVMIAGGANTTYEFRNPWQRAWAQYQMGNSVIDYVRPAGAGGESLLLNYGQIGRRSRAWWVNILEEFRAAGVLIPIARLERQWPGGPVKGHFTARYGPDNRFLESFTMEAQNEDELPDMLDSAIARFDEIFTRALADGKLNADSTLKGEGLTMDPAVAALIEAARQAEMVDALTAAERLSGTGPAAVSAPDIVALSTFSIQFATPNAAAMDAGVTNVRATPGVRGASISSTAIGGVSVMRVNYAGSLDQLAAALRARGWQVNQGSNALAISR